ncbi:IS1634 family transposase [Arthrobacter sp. JSM 101049]|uniref:IS1634 family transposase n=1 Tax=Arthrobacter sp. JSM 101049 TaxID=929097 RepID=UPI003567F33F
MSKTQQAVHVARTKSRRVNKAGETVEYESVLLRRSYRQDGKVKHETLANLASLPETAIEDLRASLAGKTLIEATAGLEVTRSLPAGHIDAVNQMARGLGFESLLGPACRQRDVVMGLITARICTPASKLASLRWFADTTLATDLGPVTTDEAYHAMDWLLARQPAIESKLAHRYLGPDANPDKLALFDLSSSWVTGHHNPLAARGYSRDKKKGVEQIEYGMLSTRDGLPIAVRVVPGNTADPAAFTAITTEIKDLAGVDDMVMVGDRGMITSARIRQLADLGGLGWVTCLRAPAIQALTADDGPLQMRLFDEQDLAEINHPDYPGERLIACRNPALAAERARKRDELLDATETELDTLKAAVKAGRLAGAGKIGIKVGKVIDKYKMAKHLEVTITDDSLSHARRETEIAAEAALDGLYVIRTSVPATSMDADEAVRIYKSLANVEKIFKSLKSVDLRIRPIHHHTEDRTRAHVLLCMLAGHLTWHLRHAWAPLTYTDQDRPTPENPVTAATRSPQAQAKASTRTLPDGTPAHSYQSLLRHLATRTRNTLRAAGTEATFELTTLPTPTQRETLELIDHHLENQRK